MACLKRKQVEGMLRRLAVAKEIGEQDPDVRVNIWEIWDEAVDAMIRNQTVPQGMESNRIQQKLQTALANVRNQEETLDPFIENLQTTFTDDGKVTGDMLAMRQQAIALQEVMDSLKGEVDKAGNEGIDVKDVSAGKGEIPNLPAHRLAATIGRKIMYLEGYRFKKGEGKGAQSRHVEFSYYMIGMTALESLEDNGFIKLHEAGAQPTIKDYLDNINQNRDYRPGKNITHDVPAVELKLKSLGIKSKSDPAMKYFTDRATAEIDNHPLNVYVNALRAINLVSQPENITFPDTTKPSEVRHNIDVYQPDSVVEGTRKELETKPVYIDSDLHDFFLLMYNDLKNTDRSASSWLNDQITNQKTLRNLFQVERSNSVVADQASFSGRNLSKTTPIDDLIEYYSHFESNNPLYMTMFAGRNGRMYYENSVVNPHASKMMRHALTVDEYSMDVDSDVYKFYVGKVAAALGIEDTPGALLDNNDTSNVAKQITKAIGHFDNYQKAKTANAKLNQLKKLSEEFPGLDFAMLLTTVKAAKGIRDSRGKKTLKSTYAVSSDATASGGQLTFQQALGSEPETIRELMVSLGIFKGREEEAIEPTDDIYKILSTKLDNFIEGDENVDSLEKPENAENLQRMTFLVKKVLFDGKMRNLSKAPTMTFIYDQSRGGAVSSLSQDFTDLMVEKLKESPVSQNTIELLNELTGEEYTAADISALKKDRKLKLKLRAHFKESEFPGFLHDALTQSLTNKYLDKHKKLGEQIFKFVNQMIKDPDFRVYPASTVITDEQSKATNLAMYTKDHLKKNGLPMSKIFEVLNTVDDTAVLNRQGKLQPTVMNVSFIHGIDTSNLYRSLNGLLNKHNSGAVVVHDDIRSNPHLVMEAEKAYVQANYDAAYHFDIHEQVLKAAEAYYADANPGKSLNGIEEYTKLKNQVEAAKAAKQKILEESYDFETSNIIGDAIDLDAITEPSKTRTKKKSFPEATSEEILQDLSTESEIIQGFLNDKGKAKTTKGEESQFDPQTDTIVLSEIDPRTKKPAARKEQIELIEHEIVHSYTAGLIAQWSKTPKDLPKQTALNFKYIQQALPRVAQLNLSEANTERLQHVFNQASEDVQLAEFISIMSTEPAVATEVYQQLGGGSRLKQVIENIVAKVREIISNVTQKDLDTGNIDAVKLNSAINGVIKEGQLTRNLQTDMVRGIQKEFDQPLFAAPQGEEGKISLTDSVNYINEAVARRINDPALQQSGRIIKNTSDYLKVNFPAYRRALQRGKGIYDDSEALQSLMHKITNDKVDNVKKNEILSMFAAVRSDKNHITSKELQRFKSLTAQLSESEKADFYDFTHKMSMGDYFQFAEDVQDVQNELRSLEENMPDHQVKRLQTIVDMNTQGLVNDNTAYNVAQVVEKEGKAQNRAKKWVVLKSIEAMGEDRFNKFKQNNDLVQVIRDVTLANATIMLEGNLSNMMVRDNQVTDVYEKPVIMKVITRDDIDRYGYTEKSGWKMALKPTENELGVVYKEEIDSTYQEGTFTDIRMESGDIDVPDTFRGKPNVILVNGRYKYILDQSTKEKMGLQKDASQGLVRSMTHNLAIKESNVIRDKLLEKETYWNMDQRDMDQLQAVIKDPDRDHPWFLGTKDMAFTDLPPQVRAKYMPVPKQLSEKGTKKKFNDNIKYVRKDISYWLVGASEQSLARDPKLKWAIRITKDLVAGAKIGMVILNPVKIAIDNVSNVAYLGVMGVDPLFMQKQYRSIAKEFDEYTKLRNEMLNLRVKSYANPDKYSKKLKQLEKRVKEHSANGLVERGFINSLGSEIVMNAEDPSSGFKSDIDTVLKTIFQNKEGKHNAVGQFLMNFSRWNVGVEQYLEIFGKVPGAVPSGKAVESEINRMADRIKHIKNEDDLISYLHQYLNSPDSEFVKLGTHMTDLTDILAKETYYRYLVQQGIDPKKAETEVVDSFPDYKEGLPTRVKQLSDVGILMFPSYWIRIQKAIYRMMKNRPVSFGTEMAIEDWAGIDAPQIWDQNIIKKANSNYGLVHTPWDHIGVGSLLPMHVV